MMLTVWGMCCMYFCINPLVAPTNHCKTKHLMEELDHIGFKNLAQSVFSTFLPLWLDAILIKFCAVASSGLSLAG